MKVTIKGDVLCLSPENDMDCYDLGMFSQNITYTLKATRDTANAGHVIDVLEVKTDSIWVFLRDVMYYKHFSRKEESEI